MLILNYDMGHVFYCYYSSSSSAVMLLLMHRSRCSGKTGVEMEALTGCSIAALTIYDMTKALSHNIILGETKLMKKTGGKSDFTRTEKE